MATRGGFEHRPIRAGDSQPMIWRIVKYLIILLVLAGLALMAYAYVGPVLFPADFAAPSEEVTAPVTLELE